MLGNNYDSPAKQTNPISPVMTTVEDLGGVIRAIEENLADLADVLAPVLRPTPTGNGKDGGAEVGPSCELEGRLRSKVNALAIINDAIVNLRSRVAV